MNEVRCAYRVLRHKDKGIAQRFSTSRISAVCTYAGLTLHDALKLFSLKALGFVNQPTMGVTVL